LAHEVGTPIDVILGRAESLLKHTQEERIARGLQIIIAQLDRMTRLIRQRLTFARRKPLGRRMMGINAAVEGGVALVSEHARPFRCGLRRSCRCGDTVRRQPDASSPV